MILQPGNQRLAHTIQVGAQAAHGIEAVGAVELGPGKDIVVGHFLLVTAGFAVNVHGRQVPRHFDAVVQRQRSQRAFQGFGPVDEFRQLPFDAGADRVIQHFLGGSHHGAPPLVLGLDFQGFAQFLARGRRAVRVPGQGIVGKNCGVAGMKVVGGENPQGFDETLGRLFVVSGFRKHGVVRVVAHQCSPRRLLGLVWTIDLYYPLQKMRERTRSTGQGGVSWRTEKENRGNGLPRGAGPSSWIRPTPTSCWP